MVSHVPVPEGPSNKFENKNIKKRKNVLKGANVWRDKAAKPTEQSATEDLLKPTRKPLFKLNDKGERVKRFKDGVERPFIDLVYEENETIMRYDGFFIKREDAKAIDDLKDELKIQGLDKREINKKVMKVLRKAKRQLFKEKLYAQKYEAMKKGEFKGATKVRNKKKTERNGKEKTSCDDKTTEEADQSAVSNEQKQIEQKEDDEIKNDVAASTPKSIKFEENNLMSCVQGFWIRRSVVGTVDTMKREKITEIKNSRSDGETDSPLTKQEDIELKIHMKKELHRLSNQLRSFLLKTLKKKIENPPKPQPVAKKKKFGQKDLARKNGTGFGQSKSGFGQGNSGFGQSKSGFGQGNSGFGQSKSGFGQGNSGFGQSKSGFGQGNSGFGQSKSGFGQGNSGFGSSDRNGYFGNRDNRMFDKFCQEELVRFDGYWVKKEAADRLKKLKAELKAEGATTEVIAEKMKAERRRAENDLKHERKTVCFSCRKPGHQVADCPLKGNTTGVGSCFTCGSLEHQSSSCPKSNDSKDGIQTYKYATCFICREKGHITINCPKNDKGIYPKGGSCTLCDSKMHLIKDCPRNPDKDKERKEVTASIMRADQDLETIEDEEAAEKLSTKKKIKKVIF